MAAKQVTTVVDEFSLLSEVIHVLPQNTIGRSGGGGGVGDTGGIVGVIVGSGVGVGVGVGVGLFTTGGAVQEPTVGQFTVVGFVNVGSSSTHPIGRNGRIVRNTILIARFLMIHSVGLVFHHHHHHHSVQ